MGEPAEAVEARWTAELGAPFGRVMLVASGESLVRVYLTPQPADDAVPDLKGAPEWLRELAEQMRRYLDGRRVDFSGVPVALSGVGPFAEGVLNATRQIGYGETSTYTALATAAGSPKGARAVGNVVSRNRVPIIVPCHRVLPKAGGLGGFGAGPDIKKALLGLEGVDV